MALACALYSALKMWAAEAGGSTPHNDSLWSCSTMPAVSHRVNAMQFHHLSGQNEDTILQDAFRLLPQAILRVSESSAVTWVEVSAFFYAVYDSLPLASLCFTGQSRFPLPFLCLVFQCFIWVPVRPRTFCDLGSKVPKCWWGAWTRTASESGSQFKGLKALCTSQSPSPILFSNLIGLDFMAEHLWLLFCLLSTLNS